MGNTANVSATTSTSTEVKHRSRSTTLHRISTRRIGFQRSSISFNNSNSKRASINPILKPNTGTEVKAQTYRKGTLKPGQFVLRRFSFQRSNSIRSSFSLKRVKPRNKSSGTSKEEIELQDSEIDQLANSKPTELHYLNFSLKKWEQIYRALTRLYAQFNKPQGGALETESVEQKPTKVNKWTVERALDKVSRCIETHHEYRSQQVSKWSTWENDNNEKNQQAFEEMFALVPENIKTLSVDNLISDFGFSKPLARRIIHKKVFHLLRMPSEEIRQLHPTDFGIKGRMDFTGLDIVELRAVYYATRDIGIHSENFRLRWRASMRDLLYELSVKEKYGTLGKFSQRHRVYQNATDVSEQKLFIERVNNEEKDKLTVVLRVKTQELLNQIRKNLEDRDAGEQKGLSGTAKRELLTSLGRIKNIEKYDPAGKFNQVLKSSFDAITSEDIDSILEDLESATNSDEEGEQEQEQEQEETVTIENFYINSGIRKRSKEIGDKKKGAGRFDNDEEKILQKDLKEIEVLVKELSEKTDDAEELEKLLASVFE